MSPRRLRRLVAMLTQEQLALFLELAHHERAIIGDYAVRRSGDEWMLTQLHTLHTYTVIGDACTCPDNRFRGNHCKHLCLLEPLR